MGPKINEQLCYALYSTSRSITRAYKPLLEPLNLTYPQYVVMMAMWEHQSLKISDIAGITGLSNATLTPLIKRLQQNGLITKSFTSEDERQKIISLTSHGKQLAKKAKKASEVALCATGLNDRDIEKMMQLCRSIKKTLDGI